MAATADLLGLEICGIPGPRIGTWGTRDPWLMFGKPRISPLRFALSKIILEGLFCQRLWSPTLATHPSKLRLPGTPVTQGWGTLNLFQVMDPRPPPIEGAPYLARSLRCQVPPHPLQNVPSHPLHFGLGRE